MIEWIKQHHISEIECMIPDLAGAARGKIIPADKIGGDALRLPQSLFFQTVTGEYPDLFNDLIPTDLDMFLQPDIDTLRPVPWSDKAAAQVIFDCYDSAGNPIAFSPRHVLRRVIELYHAEGWQPVVAPELEFYLVQIATDPRQDLLAPVGRSGRSDKLGQSYNIDSTKEFSSLFDELYQHCAAQGFKVDGLIHEEGIGQMEINLLHGDALALADQAFLFKRSLRETALRHGLHATFMAKPIAQQPGSAMHIHQSVVDLGSGENIFSTADGKPNALLLSHIAGLQQFQPDAMAIMCPYVNSYRRIVRDMSAPINFHWDFDNRTTGFRVPDNNPKSMRVENRIASSDVNPYLAIATSLACGYIGMKRGLKPTEPLGHSAYGEPIKLSRHWYQSMQRLSDNAALREVLGDSFIDVYLAVKEVEFDSFMRAIAPWEREHLLLKV